MARLAKVLALVLVSAALSGCATITTTQLANPSNEGEVERHKYGIYDATKATLTNDGALVVCIFGNGLSKDKINYSLVLQIDGSGLDHRRILIKSASDELISEYEMGNEEIGEPCKDSASGSTARLITLNFPERIDKYDYPSHTPLTGTELRDLLAEVKKPEEFAIVKVRRAPTCSEIFFWNLAAESRDSELVRISTPTAEWTVTGNRAWYIATPFAVLLDVATFPLQIFYIYYSAAHHHKPYC